ncbi:PucR family transcriptional regulator ligand-binding domain-containing protein, partial [Streptomyces thermoalcalitolerans]|uniref:PucR family transcriptional regulator ligand-binding domain-containing protein n=1 Tax=Streptomyces thermoalcalitolerans TaxID=65605 RepID=UPI003CD0BE91
MPDPYAPAVPAVPPTPPVPLSALLAREDLGLRHIAGPAGRDTVIHWVHTSEMADPYPYLLGGELLLTAGVHVPSATAAASAVDIGPYFDTYVSQVVAAGGAALGFGLAPVHDTVPPALVAACDAQGLPLLEVPPQTPFSAITRAVWQLMAQVRLAELRRVTEAQQSLAAAASRPNPVPSVLRQLAQRLGGWAVLHGPDGAEIASAGRVPREEVRTALAQLVGVVRPAPAGSPRPPAPAARPAHPPSSRQPEAPGRPATGSASPGRTAPSSATDTVDGSHLAAYALGTGRGFVLAVAAPERSPGDHTVASVATVLLSLLTGEHQSGTGAARSSALVRMLLGAAPEEVAPLLGAERWLVVHAQPDAQAPDPMAASALGTALGSALVDLADGVVRVLVPAEREPAPQPGWTLGVSTAVTAADWPAADVQAARALARA